MSEQTAQSVPDALLHYDGTFDLTFLREGETVGSEGDGTGACWVQQKTGLNTARGMRLDIGDVLARNECGELYAYTPAPEPEYEYVLQVLTEDGWKECGSGPCGLGSVEADFRGWREQSPDRPLRITRRVISPWTLADHPYNGLTDEWVAATAANTVGRS